MTGLAINGGQPVRQTEFPQQPYKFSEHTAMKVKEIVLSGKTHHGSGKYVAAFEREFADYIGTPYALATNSGTSALQLALHALGIGPDDEVLVPAYTFIAVAQAVLAQGAIPVFVDIDDTYNISPAGIREAIAPQSKAIIAVHMFGNVARIDTIRDIAFRHKLGLIEDCAQAIGAQYNGQKVGSIGHLGCFSFNVKKAIPTGQGGMLVTAEPNLAERARWARNSGIDENRREVVSVGYTMFMTELQAALGLAALHDLDKLNKTRIANAQQLLGLLSNFSTVLSFPTEIESANPSYFRFAFQVDEDKLGISRDKFLKAVRAEGIPLKTFYPRVLYSHPLFQKRTGFGNTTFPFDSLPSGDYSNVICPGAEAFCRGQVAMELSPYLTSSDIYDVAHSIEKVLTHYLDRSTKV